MVRIETLGQDAQAVLRVAAVAGARVRHALLEAAAPIERDSLLAGVREAVANHVLIQEHDSDVYRFRHALLREALVDDLLPGERGPLHAAHRPGARCRPGAVGIRAQRRRRARRALVRGA